MSLKEMPVEDFMISDVIAVKLEDTVGDVINSFLNKGISGAPVVDKNGFVVSVISQTNLITLGVTVGLTKKILVCLSKLPKVEDLIFVHKEDTFVQVFEKFLTKPVHRVLVMDAMGKLEGIISQSTVLKVVRDNSKED